MYKHFFKRVIDIAISITVLLVFSPILLVVSIVLYISNDGAIFFTQTRVGKNDTLFKLVKFKSMNDKKDENGELLKDVERLTKFGLFIRKTSLDELPQVFNILKGQMSVVGPRPLLVEYLPYYNEHHKRRHEVKPGITGLAQVNGRNGLTFGQRFDYDVAYVDSFNFIKDVVILFQTFAKFFKKSEISIGRPMSEVDDIGITKGLASHYFNTEKDEE